jgi:branched-chain amino acid transport system substrate-binding protein
MSVRTGFSRRRVLGIGGAAGSLAALTLAGCGGDSAAGGSASGSGGGGAEKPSVTIGASISATGANARMAQFQKEGYELWAEQVNARGGLLGRPVKLALVDDASEPTNGTMLYDKLIAEDKVDLILGPYANSVAQAASTVAEKARYPMISAGASASDIWKRNYKHVFGVFAIPESYFYGVIDLAAKSDLKKIAIVNEDTVFPNATAGGTAAYARSKGLQVVYQEKYPTKATDLSTLLGKVKAAAPDVLLGASYEPDSILLTKQMKELDVNVKLLSFSIGAATAEFSQGLGPLADGVIGPSVWEPELKTTGNKEFVDSFKKKWSHDPTFQAATGFAGGQILEAAIASAKSLDREKLRDALASLETTTILPGKYKVDDTGTQTGHTPVLIQWQGTTKVIVAPDSLASAKPKLPLADWKNR